MLSPVTNTSLKARTGHQKQLMVLVMLPVTLIRNCLISFVPIEKQKITYETFEFYQIGIYVRFKIY